MDFGSLFGGESVMGILGGLRDDDRNARSAADARQADERGAERQMAFQSSEASTARQFAERMASTQHQRQTADMRSAGLNPILSGTGGHGASAPTVGAPTGAKPGGTQQAATATGMGAVSTAAMLRRNAQEIENLKASENLTKAQTKTEGWREKTEFENIYKAFWEALRAENESKNLPILGGKITHERDILKEDLEGRKREGDIDRSDFGNIMRHLNRILNSVNSAVGVGRLFNRGSGH